MTREQGRFLLERPCFLLGCIWIETGADCFSERSYIFSEWKQHDLGVVKSGETGIIFLVRRQADIMKGFRLAIANPQRKDVRFDKEAFVIDPPRNRTFDHFHCVAFYRCDGY